MRMGPVEASGRPPSAPPASSEHPPNPPDASWEPELVLLDEEPRNTRPPKPSDPNWNPDVVLLDTGLGDGHARVPPKDRANSDPFGSWLRKASTRSDRPEYVWESGWGRTIGLIFLLALIVANILWLWNAWTYEPDDAWAVRENLTGKAAKVK